MVSSVVLLAAGAAAFTPAGWSQVKGPPAYAVYRPADAPRVELRLHVEPGDGGDIDAWFRRRIQRAPDATTLTSKPASEPAHRGVTSGMAMVKSDFGASLVITLACAGQDGRNRYAELLTAPSDPALKAHVGSATELIVYACFAPAASTAPAAKPTPTQAAAPPSASAVKDGDIEAVLYSWSQIYGIGGLQMNETTYLLLKDGSVRRDLPVERDFDAAASKAREAGQWGRWRKSGATYQLAFGGGAFETPPGALVRLPGRSGEALAGSYKTSSSYQIGGGAGAWSVRGVSFTADGRFSAFNTGGAGGSVGMGDSRVVANTVYDDEGSAGGVSGSNFGGGSSRRTPGGAADRQGTYRIDGYTLTLRYDSGRVERGFFYTDAARRSVFFRGADLMKN
ncbi:hypothetical protein [Caulobacter sp.]|uniref:hypothetical protein n=1 Tax=Caulobacter sp. TaxID=78 RepID=UPI0031D75528